MAETAQLKCDICGDVLVAKVDIKNNRVFVFCPTMLKDHDIYVIEMVRGVPNKIKEKIKGKIKGGIKYDNHERDE